MSDDQCWVCLRITPEEVLKRAHEIWSEDKTLARKIGLRASEIIREVYKKDPIYLCGKSYKSILSGLFYLLQGEYIPSKHNRQPRWFIAGCMGCQEVTTSNSLKSWFRKFPEFFPSFPSNIHNYVWCTEERREQLRQIYIKKIEVPGR